MSDIDLARARALARQRQMSAQRPKASQLNVDTAIAEGADRILAPKVEMTKQGQAALDDLTVDQTGHARALAVKAAQGLPFIGEYYDEIHDAIEPGKGDRIRAVEDAMDRRHPKASMAAEITGGVAGSIPLAAGGVSAIGSLSGIASRVAAGGAAAATASGIEGTVAGYGSGTDADSRAKNARQRGEMGALVGGVLGGLTPIIGAGAKALVRRVKGLDVATIAREFGIDKKSAQVVRRSLLSDDLAAATARLDEIGADAMLADAGRATGNLLDTAAQTGGKALRVASERVNTRAAAAGQNLSKRLDDILGPADGVRRAASDISKRTSASRQSAYTAAFARPIDYAAKNGRAIEDVLSRIPPKTLQKAVSEANEALLEASTKNKQVLAELAEDGSVIFSEMPNVQQLNEIKIALGSIARENVDQFGRKTSKGIRASRLARDLRAALGRAVPEYDRAVKLGGDKIAEDSALDVGRKVLSNGVSIEDVRDVMKGASVEVRAAAKRGLRENISQTMDTVRRTITDPNVDAREAMALIKAMSSKSNMAKVRMIVGKDAPALFDELSKAEAALALRAAMAQNSKTAIRTAGRDAMEEATSPGPIGTLKQGKPVEAAQEAVQFLTGSTRDMTVAARERVAAQIVDVLTGMRGEQASRALKLVQKSMAGQPLRDAEAAFVVRVVGDPLGHGIHQSATRLLEQQ